MSDRRTERRTASRLGTPQPQWGDNVISADFSRGRKGTRYSSTVPSRTPERSSELPQDSDLSKDSWSSTMVMRTVTSLTDSGRLSRGRTVFRSKSLLQFDAELGRVTGLVQGTQIEPFEVQVRWRPLSPRQIDYIIGELDDHPENLRLLLAGSRPSTEVSAVLFSVDQYIDSWCTCPDHGVFCKHRVCLCYALAAQFSADPLAFLSWRGFDPEVLLDRMRRGAGSQGGRRKSDSDGAGGAGGDAGVDVGPDGGTGGGTGPDGGTPGTPDSPVRPGVADTENTENDESPDVAERYTPEEFWGDVTVVPQWDDFEVQYGLELGDLDLRTQAIRRFSWNNVDQLRVLHSLGQCYDALTDPPPHPEESEQTFEREPWLSGTTDRNGDHD